jgi:hypothetical protein
MENQKASQVIIEEQNCYSTFGEENEHVYEEFVLHATCEILKKIRNFFLL